MVSSFNNKQGLDMQHISAQLKGINRDAAPSANIADISRGANKRAASNGSSFISMLFAELKFVIPKFRASVPAHEEEVAKRIWLNHLVQNKITTIQQCKKGINYAAKNCEFLPTPMQFVEWCKPSPEDFGYLSADEALAEVKRKVAPTYGDLEKKLHGVKFSSLPVMWAALAYAERSPWSSKTEEQHIQAFKERYTELCRKDYKSKFEGGEPLPTAPLPIKKAEVVPPNQVGDLLKRLRAELG